MKADIWSPVVKYSTAVSSGSSAPHRCGNRSRFHFSNLGKVRIVRLYATEKPRYLPLACLRFVQIVVPYTRSPLIAFLVFKPCVRAVPVEVFDQLEKPRARVILSKGV